MTGRPRALGSTRPLSPKTRRASNPGSPRYTASVLPPRSPCPTSHSCRAPRQPCHNTNTAASALSYRSQNRRHRHISRRCAYWTIGIDASPRPLAQWRPSGEAVRRHAPERLGERRLGIGRPTATQRRCAPADAADALPHRLNRERRIASLAPVVAGVGKAVRNRRGPSAAFRAARAGDSGWQRPRCKRGSVNKAVARRPPAAANADRMGGLREAAAGKPTTWRSPAWSARVCGCGRQLAPPQPGQGTIRASRRAKRQSE